MDLPSFLEMLIAACGRRSRAYILKRRPDNERSDVLRRDLLHLHVSPNRGQKASPDLVHEDCTFADASTNNDALYTDCEEKIGTEVAQVAGDQVPHRVVILQVDQPLYILKPETLLDGHVRAEALDAVSVEGTNARKIVVHTLFERVEWDTHMATLRMHHTMHALAINDEPDAYTGAHCHVAKRFLDA